MVGIALTFIGAGSLYLGTSIGVSIYRQRHGDPKGVPVGAPMNEAELVGCSNEVSDVTEWLQKHLEKFHYLLGGYVPEEAQRWGDEGAYWRNQWKALGKRCRFDAPAAMTRRRELDQMVDVYQELGRIEQDYTKELVRFGRDQAPRLDRVRERVRKISERLASGVPSPGDNKP